jgi:UDP-N-acetylmuramate: L-alanyl-gamma-D-glutamyl-meso-diaminopimelate ligase
MNNTEKSKRLHFIAIGGAAMHNLALALHQNGNKVSGSDDEIMEPSLSRLKNAGLLPEKTGWFPEKIDASLDGVILGMHARADNPELQRALELNIPVYSFPEFLHEHSKNKKRVVIGGSHGKTTITSMILHVLKDHNIEFDYMVGAKIDGFDTMVRLSNAPLIILEGDEYLSSPVDRRPKFHLYKADIGLISGIAWDHINVFPVYENYFEQFRIFAENIPFEGTFIYCKEDKEVRRLVTELKSGTQKLAYGIPSYEIRDGVTYLNPGKDEITLAIFGEHNLQNLEGARIVCNKLGITDASFYNSISSFKGAAKRLELIFKNDDVAMYKDFAHSPSKLKATLHAVREQYAGWNLIACMELHTFSSLNENFLEQYAGTMDEADHAFVYFNPHTVEHKKLKPISEEGVKNAFQNEAINVYSDSTALAAKLSLLNKHKTVYLMMSSGNFDGLNLDSLVAKSLNAVR